MSINGGNVKSSMSMVFFNDKPSSYWGTPIYGNLHIGSISIYGINGVMVPFSSFKIPISGMEKTNWLVVWNMTSIFPFSWECHHPN